MLPPTLRFILNFSMEQLAWLLVNIKSILKFNHLQGEVFHRKSVRLNFQNFTSLQDSCRLICLGSRQVSYKPLSYTVAKALLPLI